MSGPHQTHDDGEPQSSTPRHEGRMRAVEGLLASNFGQSRSAAVERAIAHLREAQLQSGSQGAERLTSVDRQNPANDTTTAIIRKGGSVSPARLAAYARAGKRQQAYLEINRRRRWWRTATWAGAVAASVMLAAVIGLAALGQRGNDKELRVVSFHGVAHIGNGADVRLLRAGDIVRAGETVSTGMGTALTLTYQDGTAIGLNANAQMTVGSRPGHKELRLMAGKIQADVARQPAGYPLILDTAEARAEVLGTTLVLSASRESTQLAVEHGLVRLIRASDMKAVDVPTGKRSIAQQSGALLVQDIRPPLAPVIERPLATRDGSGTGLRGEYFSGKEFDKRLLVRIDPRISFNWGFDMAPDPLLPKTEYSVRWSGEIEPRFSEEYLFSTLSDDGVRVRVNDALIIENWFEHPELLQVGSISLEAGKRYRISVEFCEWKRYSLVHLFWQSKHQWREVVPTTQLYPPPD